MRRSVIAGAAPRRTLTRVAGLGRRVFASLTIKLVVLIGVFVALPIVLYGQFETGDRKMRDLVARGVQQQSWLIAQALKPIFSGPTMPPQSVLDKELRKYASDGTTLDLMFRPDSRSDHGFYYVASTASGGLKKLDDQLDGLLAHGVLARLSHSCSWDTPSELHYIETQGRQEMLTWVLPIQSAFGCWALVSSHPASEFLNTSVSRSYWRTREVRIAGAIYLTMAMLASLVAVSVGRGIRNFRTAARAISEGRGRGHSFAASNNIPELASVASDFDRLVADLYAAARDIRQAAEDNAHSFKGPVATIGASLEPLRRLAAASDGRAGRSLALVDLSLRRLNTLIAAAQRLDNVTANLIDTPRTDINLTHVISDTLVRYRALTSVRGIVLRDTLDVDVVVNAGVGTLEAIIENILDNAISVSPPRGVIFVTLRKSRQVIDLSVDDEGPGIDPRKIGRIFERYVSLRPQEHDCDAAPRPDEEVGLARRAPHAGLGLWIVRRNVETLGGRVVARNRSESGLSIHIVLPRDRSRPIAADATPLTAVGHGSTAVTLPQEVA